MRRGVSAQVWGGHKRTYRDEKEDRRDAVGGDEQIVQPPPEDVEREEEEDVKQDEGH